MSTSDLRAITDFESFRDFLEDERDWSLSGYSFDDLTFTYVAKELGLKPEGSREEKNLFVWHESFEGPDRLSHYSLKRWHSKMIVEPDDTGESWRHSAVVLQPLKKIFRANTPQSR
ncbi:MAG: hypothetical protein CAK85_01795 [Spartobacteria bacterium AMD-G5]|nr:MAG: hypothetical protein CAK85_01795 [Spartobacteria bacterium AMD-G5]